MTSRSIRLRLTVWYALSILGLLLATTFGARTVVMHALEEEFTRSLQASIGLVQGFFRVEIAEYRRIDVTLAHIAGELIIPDRRIEFVHPDGSAFRAPDAARALMAPAPLTPPLRSVTASLNPGLAPGWQLRITASQASLMRQRQQVDRAALLAVPIATLLACLIGWLLTGRTLRPVGEMAEAADRITAAAGGRLPILVPEDELGRLGSRFNALLDRLDEALARQRRFLADAAHELRTPIARARGLGELALDAPSGSADREALRQTQRELEGMGHLVDELLALARLDADPRGVGMEPLYLDDIVAEVVRGFTPLAQRRQQRLVVDLADEVPLRGDAIGLQRMLGVLVDNALRYSPDGGRVWVRAVRTEQGGSVIVEDDGVGIPAEDRARLFERFFRGVRARAAAPDGSGLGLAIAQAVAQRHGATIIFDPDRATGTRVTVHFP